MTKRYPSIPLILLLLPVVLYWIIFFQFAYNVNYIAFDDTLILSILPSFEAASLYERWKLLSGLFPEHRLVFSRSIVLLTYKLFGKVDLTYLMTIANICYTACLYVFYRVFKSLQLSLWYFVPIAWIWMSIQAFENMFWGVSSLCNFGVLLFALHAFYYASFEEQKPWKAIIFAFLATFTYGNGLFVFPILIGLFWVLGKTKLTLYTTLVFLFIATIYFIDFTPITQNLDLTNPEQVKQGFWGLFGFIGSVATISAYEARIVFRYLGSVVGIGMVLTLAYIFKDYLLGLFKALFGKPIVLSKPLRFVLVLALFVLVTALATTYKRIPTDTFEGMFKGRYRMYSILAILSIYIGFLSTLKPLAQRYFIKIAVPFSLLFWSVIAYFNIVHIINNQRSAIVQEFNARYNADWLGLAMFDMDQAHYEKIRAYYQSEDPLAHNWLVKAPTADLPCQGSIAIDTIFTTEDSNLYIKTNHNIAISTNNYAEGYYVILKSSDHVYALAPSHYKRAFKSFIADRHYLNTDLIAIMHTANIQPGDYQIYVLKSSDGNNILHCTGETWSKNE